MPRSLKSSKRLASFRSRWTTFCLWMARNPLTIYKRKCRASSSVRCPRTFINCYRSPPLTNDMKMYTLLADRTMPRKPTTFGLRTWPRILISRFRLACIRSENLLVLMILQATQSGLSLRSLRSLARTTVPNWPLPSSRFVSAY